MAKQLGPKSILIREAITANSDLGNKEIAQLLNGSEDRKSDKIEVTPNDIAQQKQALKKSGEAVTAAKKPGRKPGPQPAAVPQAALPRAVVQGSPVDLIESVFELAQKCGGMEQLRRLVDRLAEMG